MTTDQVITVRLAGGWADRCQQCGAPVAWRKLHEGGLAKFDADPKPLRTYRIGVHQTPVQDLSGGDLHAESCHPRRKPRPLFDQREAR